MKTLLVGLCLVIGACGTEADDDDNYPPPSTGTGGTGSTTPPAPPVPPAPTNHTIFPDTPGSAHANQRVYAGPFTLPKAATVTYAIQDRSTTSPDHWDVSIISMAEFHYFQNGQAYKGFGAQENVSSAVGTNLIQAGTWYLAVACRNIIEDCLFSYEVTALY